MSSISGVSPVTNPYQTNDQAGYGQMVQNFNAIGSALQSGDLTTAQSALTAFQQALPGSSSTSTSQPFGKNSQANTDYQSLTSSLKSGDLASAQKAFTSLQKDLKPAQTTQAAHKGHHHHHSSSATAATPAATTASPTVSSSTSSTSDSAVGSDGSLNTFA
jgi:ribosomal protein S20